jgi:transcriptional regulator with XRE-family HTH domain
VSLNETRVSLLKHEVLVDDPKVLSQNLRFLRSARRLTQKELADLAGLGRATVCRLERGESAWRPATVSRLARALKVPPEELTGAPYQRNILPSAAELKMELVQGILTLDEKSLHRLHPLLTEVLSWGGEQRGKVEQRVASMKAGQGLLPGE